MPFADKLITLFILVITLLVSILAFSNRGLLIQMQFNPFLVKTRRHYQRFFSYGLIHADFMHLAVNMYVFYIFGKLVEQQFFFYFGSPKGNMLYLLMYALAIPASVIAAFIKHRNNPSYNAVGASGAVSAVVFAGILMNPQMSIFLFFIPFPIPAPIFAGIYLIYSFIMARRGKGNIGHDAHFWGAVFGLIYPILIRPKFLMEFLNHIF